MHEWCMIGDYLFFLCGMVWEIFYSVTKYALLSDLVRPEGLYKNLLHHSPIFFK